MTTTTENSLPPEVAGLFNETTAQAGAAPGPSAEDARATAAREWIGAVDMGASMLVAIKPKLAAVWTAQRRAQLGEAVAAVAAKYNWTASALLERFGAEISLAFVAVPLLLETRAVLLAETTAAPAPAADEAQPAPAADKTPAQSGGAEPLKPNTGA